MKFTLLTSFYNYIDAADDLCKSILNQTYPNWEWLICDDFSENTEVIEKLRYLESLDDRIKIIHPKWKKEYYYNLPVDQSTGDVIVKIDSDDIPSIKLLEVYKYNYEKFPNVISIGCSSILRKGDYKGYMSGAKYINYKNTSNYLESQKFGVISGIGDARSYRVSMLKNNGVFVGPEDVKFQRGEDIYQTIFIEEWGNFFAIPRILYHYSMRDDSSSGGKTIIEKKDEEMLDFPKLVSDSEKRVSRSKLFSIEKFYDSSFDHLKNFYFSGLEFESTNSNIEYWSSRLTISDIDKISTTYFDHNIIFNDVSNSPKYIVIDFLDRLDIINDALKDRNLKDCAVIITLDKEKSADVGAYVKKIGYPYWFNIFNYYTIKINL